MGGFLNTLLAISTGALSIPITKALSGGKKDGGPSPSPLPTPEAPKPEEATNNAQDIIKRKRAGMSQSVYTSPLGVAGEANVARKTLLGQ